MQINNSSKQLKSMARGQLIGHYGHAIRAEVSVFAMLLCLSMFCSTMADSYSVLGIVFQFMISLILSLIQAIFLFGLTRFYLNQATDRGPRITDVFIGFSTHADRIILAKLLLLVLGFLCMVPFAITAIFYILFKEPFVFVLACFLLIAGFSGVIFIALTYSQIYFLFWDFPQSGVKQVFRMSREIMKGNKARLFYIEASFIPYDLLGILSFGLAYLWITPFKRMVRTNFYLSSI